MSESGRCRGGADKVSASARRETRPDATRGGFSLVELVVAIMVLTVGLLALAGSTALVIRTVTLSDLNTQRSAALQATVERLRSQPFDSYEDGEVEVGPFTVAWELDPLGGQALHTRSLLIITTGPGMGVASAGAGPTMSPTATDTLRYVITRR